MRESSNTIYLGDSQTMLNNIETGRSSPNLFKSNSEINFNNNFIEKAKGGFQNLPFENQDDNKYLSEPEISEGSERVNLKLEDNVGANCCADFDKKCLIF